MTDGRDIGMRQAAPLRKWPMWQEIRNRGSCLKIALTAIPKDTVKFPSRTIFLVPNLQEDHGHVQYTTSTGLNIAATCTSSMYPTKHLESLSIK